VSGRRGISCSVLRQADGLYPTLRKHAADKIATTIAVVVRTVPSQTSLGI